MSRLAVLPLVWLSALFLAGIAASAYLPRSSPWIWAALTVLSLAAILPEKRWARKFRHKIGLLSFSPLPAALLLAAFCAGSWIYQSARPQADATSLSFYNFSEGSAISGWVSEIPDEREKYTLLTVEAESIQLIGDPSPRAIEGRLLVRWSGAESMHYGDRLLLQGSPSTPPEAADFSYREFLATRGIYSFMPAPVITRLDGQSGSPLLKWILFLREKVEDNLKGLLPGEEAALLVGILLGDDNGLPASIQSAFRETGTAHILAVSGFNISILVALLAALFKRLLPRLWAFFPLLLGILLFSAMVGGQASVVRAAVMGISAQIGLALGRRPGGGSALLFTAALMSAFNPLILWDIGFQLSFAATAGIMLWGDALSAAALKVSLKIFPAGFAEKIASWLAEFLLITLAAQVFTLPVSAYHFHTFSWIGLIANPLVLPAQQLLMILGGLTALTSLIFQPLGQLFAWLVWPFCAYTLTIVHWLAALGQGSLQTGQFGFALVALYYGMLLAASSFWRILLPFLRRAAWPAALLISGSLSLLVWRAYFVAPDGQLHILRMSYAGETAYFLTTPGRNHILIGGLSQPQVTINLIGRETFPFPPRLDAVVLSGEKKSAEKGLSLLLSGVHPRQILTLSSTEGLVRTVTGKDPDMAPALGSLYAGQSYRLGDGAFLKVMRVDAACADFEVVYNQFHAWLSGCPLSEVSYSGAQQTAWTMISLAGTDIGKTGEAILARTASVITFSPFADPGLLTHPNWREVRPDQNVLILTDGSNMGASLLKR